MSAPTERLVGRATAEGSKRGAESFAEGARSLGRTGLTVAPVGFGGYRVTVDSPLHRRALADALRGGSNLIDTSTNYAAGRSESLVGMMLAHLIQRGEVRREQIVVVSKVGYIQSENLDRVQARAEPYPEVVRVSDDCWHCIHPDFIRDQLEEALDRLGLCTLDVLLLHNPEYFLDHDAATGGTQGREVFDQRLRAAFGCLEELVEEGKIGWYGVSSNGFVEPESSPRWTSLRRMLELATEAGGESHHFGVAQFPMNLFELGAAREQREDGGVRQTVLETASANDIGVLLNRPLNAFVQREERARLLRLADAGDTGHAADPDTAAVLAKARKLEAQWATGLGARLRTEDGSDDAVDLFVWGRELSGGLEQIEALAQWQRLRYDVIAPHLAKTSAALLQVLQGEDKAEFGRWWAAYGTCLHEVFEAIEARLRAGHDDVAAAIGKALDPCLPAPWRDLPLSRKAVLTLLSAPVSCVLVGMRQPGYVHDILALRDQPMRLLSAGVGPVDFEAVAQAMSELPL